MATVRMDDVRGIIEEIMEPESKRELSSKINTRLIKGMSDPRFLMENKDDGILSISIAISSPDEKSSPFKKALGKRAPLHSSDEVDTDTLYNVGSISKFILMVMIVRLIQEKKLQFEHVISEYLADTDLPNSRFITIEHLLGHRSGLKDCDFIELHEADPIIKLLKLNKENTPDLAGEPGEKFYYANINFVVLAKIIQQITHKNLQESFIELIGEVLSLEKILVIDKNDSSLKYAAGYKPNLSATKIIDASGCCIFGATSFRATPDNLIKLMENFFKNDHFIHAELRNKIVNSVKDETFEVVTKTDTYRWPARMGLGIEERQVVMSNGVSKKIYCHGGWQDSNAAFLAFSPTDAVAYCCCVSKTQGLKRIHRIHRWNAKPVVLASMGLIAVGALFAICRHSSKTSLSYTLSKESKIPSPT